VVLAEPIRLTDAQLDAVAAGAPPVRVVGATVCFEPCAAIPERKLVLLPEAALPAAVVLPGRSDGDGGGGGVPD
jgi:hypothetical protein